MKFLIIDKRKRVGKLDTEHYAVQRLGEILDDKAISYEFCHFDEIQIQCKSGRLELLLRGAPLTEFTHIIPRGHRPDEYKIKQYLAMYCSQNNIKMQNLRFIEYMSHYNKIFQMTALTQADLPYLDSYYCLDGQYHKKPKEVEALGFPLIYKHIEGEYRVEKIDGEDKLKKNVYLIDNVEALEEECTSREDPEAYFVQKFANIGEDYRAIIIGGKFFAAWQRKAPEGEFLTVTKGSEYKLYDKPSSKFLALSDKVTSLFKADYCAIDIIQDSGKLYVLEINQSPGFKAFETKIEGANLDVAKAIIESMI